MWVALDRFGGVLLDATLATSVMMGVVILLLLLCRQPARRITIARPAAWLALLMIPTVAFTPFPGFNPFGWLFQSGDLSLGALPEWCRGPWPLRIFTLVYLGAVALGLVWLLLGYWGVSRLVGQATSPRPQTLALYGELVPQSGFLSGCPELRVSRRLRHPVLVSLIHPYILIPPDFEEPQADPDSLRWALVHELAHAHESHGRLMLLASLAQAVWFFLPFLHWMRAQLRLDQEFLADQRAVAIAGSSAQYAKRLVSLAHEGAGLSAAVRPGVPGARAAAGSSLLSPLLQRVMVLLRAPFPLEARPPRRWAILAPLFVVALGGLCSSLRLTIPDAVADARPGQVGLPGTRKFQVDQFLASPRGTHASGRSLAYILPLPLPPQFDLTVEIRVAREGLSRMRLAGLPLDQPAGVGGDLQDSLLPPASDSEWHRVQVRRTSDRVELVVDDRHSIVDQARVPLSEWLTVEPPPDLVAVLRNLVVAW